MSRTPSADTARLVHEAAACVLAERGPGGLTVRAVAQEAGVSAQSIYNRFGSQDALLDDLATAGYRQLATAMLGVGPDSLTLLADPLDRLTELFRRAHTHAMADPNRHRFLFDEPMPWRSNRTAEAEAEVFTLSTVVVRQAIEAGRLLPGDPADVALRLWAASLGAIRLEIQDDDQWPEGPTRPIDTDATMATMIRGLRPRRSLSSGSRR